MLALKFIFYLQLLIFLRLFNREDLYIIYNILFNKILYLLIGIKDS